MSSQRKTTMLYFQRIAIGSDHGGFPLKSYLITQLQRLGVEIADLGTHSVASCDYPVIGYKVADVVGQGKFDGGILVCKSGIGMAIVANKVNGVRAAVCGDLFDAGRSRAHNNANMLVIGAEKLSRKAAERIVRKWITSSFDFGSRHERRVKQITLIETKVSARSPNGIKCNVKNKSVKRKRK